MQVGILSLGLAAAVTTVSIGTFALLYAVC